MGRERRHDGADDRCGKKRDGEGDENRVNRVARDRCFTLHLGLLSRHFTPRNRNDPASLCDMIVMSGCIKPSLRFASIDWADIFARLALVFKSSSFVTESRRSMLPSVSTRTAIRSKSTDIEWSCQHKNMTTAMPIAAATAAMTLPDLSCIHTSFPPVLNYS